MGNTKLKKGQRVQHMGRPDWGLGQLLEDENANEIRVFFVNNAVVRLGATARNKLQVMTGIEAHNELLDRCV